MIILLTAVAVLIMGVPLAAVILVTFASRREERARSIAGRAPGNVTGAARRLLGFRATGIALPARRTTPTRRRNETRAAGGRGDGPDRTDPLDPRGGPALAGGPLSLR